MAKSRMSSQLLMKYILITDLIIIILTFFQDFCWAADTYIHEYRDCESLFALRANRETLSKKDSNDDLLIHILTLLDSKSLPEQAKLIKSQKMQIWLIQTFRCTRNHVGWLLQVIHAQSSLCDIMMKGAVHFCFTWASQIVLSSLDFVSLLQWTSLNRQILTKSRFGNSRLASLQSMARQYFMIKLKRFQLRIGNQ